MRSSNAQNTVPMIMKTIAPYLDVFLSKCSVHIRVFVLQALV